MRKYLFHIHCSLLIIMLMGCSNDDVTPSTNNTPTEDNDDIIMVMASAPGAATRVYVDPNNITSTENIPSQPGVCKADKIDIWQYSSSYGISFKDNINELTNTSSGSDNLLNTTQNNRWLKYSINHKNNAAQYFCYMLRAIAYSSADKSNGLFSATQGNDPSKSTLTVNPKDGKYITPELYHGILKFNTQDISSALSESFNNETGLIRFHGNSNKDNNLSLTGTLFRIVSQFNITLTEMPAAIIQADLIVTGLPTAMPLYGTHGKFYAVGTATSTLSEETIVATTSSFTGGVARLSTFMLPSTTGISMKVRLTLKDSDNNTETKTFNIRPSSDALLSAENSINVYTGTPATLKKNEQCILYDAMEQRFYSYANVRTNITGEYGETHIANIKLEVEPSYEQEHNITLN